MRRTVSILVAAALICSMSVVAHARVCTIVTLGSADVDPPPNNEANYSLIAIQHCDGTVKGQWQDSLGNSVSLHVKVTCLQVDGNDAWISGVVTHVNPHSVFGDAFDGQPVKTRVRDNGTSANDPPDQASFIFLADSEDDCLLKEDVALFDLVGQVQIKEF